jgi:hypothetical protein
LLKNLLFLNLPFYNNQPTWLDFYNFCNFLLLLTSNLSANASSSLAGVNIARAVALVEDGCCFRYAANAIEAPLLVVTELLKGFKRPVSTQEDLDLVQKSNHTRRR